MSGGGSVVRCATCKLSQLTFMYFFSSPPHSHPSDLKHRFHRHQSSGSLHGSFNHNHVQDTSQPLVAEEHDEEHDKGPVYDPKQDVFSSLFVSFTQRLKWYLVEFSRFL